MEKDKANELFKPASQHKSLKGQWIVWKETQTAYYANSTGHSSEDKYRIGLVAKKQGDLAITDKWHRIPLYKAFVSPSELSTKWPKWDGTDDYQPIDKDDLMELLDTI